MPDEQGEFWVLHQGALGDSVLLWPMLRALVAEGQRVVLVAQRSKSHLAASELGVTGVDAEQQLFNDLWLPEAKIVPVSDATQVVAFVGAGSTDATYEANLHRMFPRAAIRAEPERPDALFARTWCEPPHMGMPRLVRNLDRCIVCHIGAGSEGKRWPLGRFAAMGAHLDRSCLPWPIFIAGEVEAERMTAVEQSAFRSMSGRFIDGLAELAETMRAARLFIGNDSGPTHLAAQLGIPSLALFGPTETRQWGPVGPAVRILAPAAPCAMEWLSVDDVVEAAQRMWNAAGLTPEPTQEPIQEPIQAITQEPAHE